MSAEKALLSAVSASARTRLSWRIVRPFFGFSGISVAGLLRPEIKLPTEE